MNLSKVHDAAMQEQSKQCVAELDNYKDDFENVVTNFLTSSQNNFLTIETRDSKLGAKRIIQILEQLTQRKENEKALGRYLGAENQTFLHWKQLLDMAGTAEELPRFTNLLVCMFPDRESMKIENIEEEVLHKMRDRLKIAVLKKIVFITSQKGAFDEYLQQIDSNAFLKIDEYKNKVTSIFYGKKALLNRASCGDVKGVETSLQNSADVNATDGHYKLTALHVAAENGHKDVALTLLQNGANILPDRFGNTPLHTAASKGHTDVISVLLENSVDIDITNSLGETALHLATSTSHTDTVKTLLDQGANVDVYNNSKQTPLHVAVEWESKEVVNTLLNYGADINANGNNMTDSPFHYAALQGRFEIVKILIERGANVNAKNPSGKTALDLALERGYDKIVALLRSI